jgi:hypothetical protein
VPVRDSVGNFDTLLSVKKAGDLLGYLPQHSWREFVS